MNYSQKDNGLYVLSRNDIEEIATDILRKYSPMYIDYPGVLDTRDFLINYLGLQIKTRNIGDIESEIIGLIVMGDITLIPSYDEMFRPVVLEETFGTVILSPKLSGSKNRARRRYTEMHEAAHFLLHQTYFKKWGYNNAARNESTAKFIACRNVEIPPTPLKTDIDWLEYQADALAAALLMPIKAFRYYALEIFHMHGISESCLDINKYSKTANITLIILQIAYVFGVSQKAARIRMKHLGLIS